MTTMVLAPEPPVCVAPVAGDEPGAAPRRSKIPRAPGPARPGYAAHGGNFSRV